MKNFDLTANGQILIDSLATNSPSAENSGLFVTEHYKTLAEFKLFSAMVPQKFSGGGASHSEMAEFLRLLAKVYPSTALALSMHQHLIAAAVYHDQHGKPGRKILDKVAGQESVLVSTGASDWLQSNGEAIRVEGGFRVTARKPFASGSPVADVLVSSVPYQDPKEGWQVLHFLSPMSATGICVAQDWDAMGMRETGSNSILLDNVFIADSCIPLRRAREGFHQAFQVVLGVALPLIMSVYLGIAEAASEIAIGELKKRPFDPVTPYLIGEMLNHLTITQVTLASMLKITDDLRFSATLENADAMSKLKTIAALHSKLCIEKALECTGGAGYFKKLGIEKLLRDSYAAQFHPMQEKRQHLFSGRIALGLSPYE